MAYFDTYEEAGIAPGYVDHEGDYELAIKNIKNGTTPDNARYLQIDCEVNYDARPRIAVFLTEGKNFNGNFTAFCDTFGIPRGQKPNDGWIGKTGYMHIMLTEKNGFKNMIPRYILGNDHFVLEDVKKAANGGLNKPAAAVIPSFGQMQQDNNSMDDGFNELPF